MTQPTSSSLPASRPAIRSAAGFQARTLLAAGVLSATLLSLIVLGHDGRRSIQLMALALPAIAWLFWPIHHPALHRLRVAFVWLWAMGFACDGVVRAYLFEAYGAAPDGAMVQSAAANTNGRETREYLSTHWRSMLLWASLVVAAGAVFARLAQRGARDVAHWPRWARATLALVLLVAAAAYASKSWRRLHPILFWANWSQSVHTLRAGWADQQNQRDALMARANAVAPTVARAGRSTTVLVISDSINRDNMSLYGYGRATTPRLLAEKSRLKDQMLVLRNAWSVDASTLPSLRNMLNFGAPDDEHPQHVLALARAAGYKIWWMSNHEDIAIEQQHARLADVVEMVNRTPGRAAASLDDALLDCVQEALEDPAERKLIVVHLMGAHPHYRLRFPEGGNPFDGETDGVEEELERSGRSAWVRKFRQEYDAAMLYHDSVVSQTLELTRLAGRQDEDRAWMYLSDHGQEVGHNGNHAGHSPRTASGYRIPTIVWRNSAPTGDGSAHELRPFRADWAGWTVADLLHLDWKHGRADRNVLAGSYDWQAPVLPVTVRSFVDQELQGP